MEVTLLGMVNEVRPLQPWKAELPMEVTLLGMVTEVRPLQPEKAELPMEVTLLAIVREVRALQLEKAELPIVQTPSPKMISLIDFIPLNHEPTSLQWNVKEVKPLQP